MSNPLASELLVAEIRTQQCCVPTVLFSVGILKMVQDLSSIQPTFIFISPE